MIYPLIARVSKTNGIRKTNKRLANKCSADILTNFHGYCIGIAQKIKKTCIFSDICHLAHFA